MDRRQRRGYVAAMRVGRLVTGAGRAVRARLAAGWCRRDVLPLHGIALSALAGWVAFSIGCEPGAGEVRSHDRRPNVLMISIDTVRADHLSTYGYARPTSPRLTALAEEGARVRVAYAPSATTGPTHASLFTALPPIAHGVRKNGQPLDAGSSTLAERLTDIGFETGAVVSSYVLSRRFGYDQGFAHFDDDFSEAEVPEGSTLWEGETIEGRFYGRADDTTNRALDWLDERSHPERPFFLFVHYFDPHDPYVPPADFEPPFAPSRKEALKLNRTLFVYDLLIAWTDEQIGRLLDGLGAAGLADDTLVIVTGDHGEGLMAHGHMFHGVHVYEEAVRVPLVVRWPGRVPAGRVVDGPFPIVELGPAILALLGDEPADAFGDDGAAARLLGEGDRSADDSRPVFLYRRHYSGDEDVGDGLRPVGEKYAVRVGKWKLIEGPEEGTLELYDLERDPEERLDLAPEEPNRVSRMKALIAAWRARYDAAAGAAAPLSDEARERLKAMGYVE